MKKLHRALALMLTLMMVLTYMPALAFAEDADTDMPRYWYVEGDDVVLAPGQTSCDLKAIMDLNQMDYYEEEGYALPTFSYRWVERVYDEDAEETVEKDVGTGSTLKGAGAGSYICYVTDSYGQEDYNFYEVSYAEPTGLTFTPVKSGVRELWRSDQFMDGDKITLEYSNFDDTTYTYTSGKWLYKNTELPYVVDALYEDGSFDIDDEENIGKNFTYEVRCNYDSALKDGPFNAKCISGVASVSFTPATISVWGPNILVSDQTGSFYDIERRYKWTTHDGDEYTWYAKGDSLTVKFIDGKTVTYKAGLVEISETYNTPYFINGDDFIWLNLEYDNLLQPGKNSASVSYRKVKAPVTIFVDDPAQKAQRDKAAAAAKAEKARQGVADSKIPKVKGAKKSKVSKSSITLKWTKLTSKQLKKSKATKYEIWACPNKKFASADTKMKTVSKSKSSGKISGLKKKTNYYVKVRAIRYANGVKYVGAWSSVKKIKTK